FVRLSPAQKGIMSPGTGASTTEALVGAVWIDSNRDFTTAHRVIHNLDIGTEFSQNVDHVPDNIESAAAALAVV
ncbi:hypothetical protein ACHAQJ_005986, partial [Trichoderma viride]